MLSGFFLCRTLRTSLALATILSLSFSCLAQQPNFLFLFADDWGRYASAYAKLEPNEPLQGLVRTPNIDRIAQCERSNTPVAQFCQSINCSPTSYYQWKRKLAAKPQATAFLRVQTSDSTKDSIEIKLPSGISILVPVSAVESISAILEQVA